MKVTFADSSVPIKDISTSLVSPIFAERLYKLKGYEIVFICDDSGSMTAPIGEFRLRLKLVLGCLSMFSFRFTQVKLPVHPRNKEHAVKFNKLQSDNDLSTPCLLLFSGDELKQTVSIVVDLASTLDSDGVDVYFLNREPMLHVRNASDLETIFAMDPEGR